MDKDGSINDININLKKIISSVDSSEFSSINEVVSKVISVINDPESTIKDLKDIIKIDPPLSSKILRMVNSAYYSRGRVHTNIESSIIWIGFDIVKEMALNQKVCEIFNKDEVIEGYSRKKLWKHSVAVATMAKMIFRKEFGYPGDTAYVSGLLHDIGMIAEDQFVQEKFKKILNVSKEENKPIEDLETQYLGYNHADLGFYISAKWGLPLELREGIRFHHNPQYISENNFKLPMTILVSDFVCNSNEYGIGFASNSENNQFENCLDQLKIKSHSINMITKDLIEEMNKMEDMDFF